VMELVLFNVPRHPWFVWRRTHLQRPGVGHTFRDPFYKGNTP
jgi:hypothetical protein